MNRRLVCTLAAVLLSACSDGLLVDSPRQPGIIQSQYLTVPVIAAPATVAAGQAFTVTVTTLGFSGCWRADGADVRSAAAEATIQPYDRVLDGACGGALANLPRTVQLRFDTPGTAKIVVEGRTDPTVHEAPARVEQTVTVQ